MLGVVVKMKQSETWMKLSDWPGLSGDGKEAGHMNEIQKGRMT